MDFDEWIKTQDYRPDGILAMVAREAWHCCTLQNEDQIVECPHCHEEFIVKNDQSIDGVIK